MVGCRLMATGSEGKFGPSGEICAYALAEYTLSFEV